MTHPKLILDFEGIGPEAAVGTYRLMLDLEEKRSPGANPTPESEARSEIEQWDPTDPGNLRDDISYDPRRAHAGPNPEHTANSASVSYRLGLTKIEGLSLARRLFEVTCWLAAALLLLFMVSTIFFGAWVNKIGDAYPYLLCASFLSLICGSVFLAVTIHTLNIGNIDFADRRRLDKALSYTGINLAIILLSLFLGICLIFQSSDILAGPPAMVEGPAGQDTLKTVVRDHALAGKDASVAQPDTKPNGASSQGGQTGKTLADSLIGAFPSLNCDLLKAEAAVNPDPARREKFAQTADILSCR